MFGSIDYFNPAAIVAKTAGVTEHDVILFRAAIRPLIERAAKRYAAENGYRGAQGGWIYRVLADGSWRPVIQGWSQFTDRVRLHVHQHYEVA